MSICHSNTFETLFIFKKNKMSKNSKMTPAAQIRIQVATAKANGGNVPKGSFGARTQSTVSKNANVVKGKN